jgi:hypothetical protein
MLNRSNPTPTSYDAEIAILLKTGWSWRELQETPADLVDALLEHISADAYWSEVKARQSGKTGHFHQSQK